MKTYKWGPARKLARQKNLSSKYLSDKLNKNYYETDFKTFLLSYPIASDDSDHPD